ncbi:hypothetical protein [Streptomyces bambusae]|uniref:hypothetical protein n=1 Tax=Streptomyces bambusae TaxID=1550616 RepID=UPI002155A692|nr:hypothetical protein [Streptomyces bambusae]
MYGALLVGAMTRALGESAARRAIGYAAPVGEQHETVERVMRAVRAGETVVR